MSNPHSNSSPHLDNLKAKHDELDESISKKALSPSSDDLEIAQMKREKLALRDRISKNR